MVAAERRDLVDFLRTLSHDDWLVPSLCEGWLVRDVVAHLMVDTFSITAYAAALMRKHSADRVNQHFVDRAKTLPIEDLINRLESTIGRGWASFTMPGVMLADLVVHHQDVRRPLNRSRMIHDSRLRHTLSNADPFAKPHRYVRGLKWVALDIDWTRGPGPEVRGSGEALALAMVGRSAVIPELEGEGVRLLAQRLLA